MKFLPLFPKGSIIAGVILLSLTLPSKAHGIVLDFENIQDLNNYGGLTWLNFAAIDEVDVGNIKAGNKPAVFEQSGFNNFNQNGGGVGGALRVNPDLKPTAVGIIKRDEPFTFNSISLTAAWNNGLKITIRGLLSGQSIHSEELLVNTTEPTQFIFDKFIGIDELQFTSFGGIDIATGRPSQRTQFIIDDLAFNASNEPIPEPLTILGSLSALGIGVLMKRSR
ncbi:MAG: PEP-CTERM sorting domain-containing protein [Microcoleaceae cyanobacterium]